MAFAAVPHYYQAVLSLLRRVPDESALVVPPQIFADVAAHLTQMATRLDAVEKFSAAQANAQDLRNSLENEFERIYATIFPLLIQIIEASRLAQPRELHDDALERLNATVAEQIESYRARFDATLEAAAKGYVERTNEEAESVRRALEQERAIAAQHASQLQALLEEFRLKAADVIAVKESERFTRAAAEFGGAAKSWLMASIVGAVVLLILAGLGIALVVVPSLQLTNPVVAAQATVAKLFLIGVVAYATTICVRSHLANRHNQAVNEHRANAISSYRALVEATSSAEHKDVILNHAASAVFSPQDTAFVKQAAAAPENATTVISTLMRPPSSSN